MQPAPENLDAVVRGVEEFIARQMREGRRVVLVTVSRHSHAFLIARVRTSSPFYFTLHTWFYPQENWMLTSYILLRRISPHWPCSW